LEEYVPRCVWTRSTATTLLPSTAVIAVGHVLLGLASPKLLDTYTLERQIVAKTLIDFDTKFSKLFSGKPKGADGLEEEDSISLEEFHKVFAKGNEFA
jgi:phenol 2-monooxygenase